MKLQTQQLKILNIIERSEEELSEEEDLWSITDQKVQCEMCSQPTSFVYDSGMDFRGFCFHCAMILFEYGEDHRDMNFEMQVDSWINTLQGIAKSIQITRSTDQLIDRLRLLNPDLNIDDYFKKNIKGRLNVGWKYEDVYNFFKNSEEIDPTLDENIAIHQMNAISSKYPNTK